MNKKSGFAIELLCFAVFSAVVLGTIIVKTIKNGGGTINTNDRRPDYSLTNSVCNGCPAGAPGVEGPEGRN